MLPWALQQALRRLARARNTGEALILKYFQDVLCDAPVRVEKLQRQASAVRLLCNFWNLPAASCKGAGLPSWKVRV